MTTTRALTSAIRVAVPGATVTRSASARVPAALVVAALPLVAPVAAHAQSCDNLALPGGGACVSTISAGKTVTGTTISAGGTQTVRGNAVSTDILSGGQQVVSKGGIASGTTVSNGGLLTVLSAGSTVSAVVSSGGTQYVSSGGTASGTLVVSGGSFGVSRGGLAVDALVNSGGLQRVYSGGLVSGNVVAGGKQYVSAGGSAVGTVVSAGSQVVFKSGTAISTVVDGGIQLVSSGGLAQGTQVNAGGAQTVLLGGSAVQSTVAAGGSLTVDVGGATSSGVVAAQTLSNVTLAGTLTIDEASSDALTGNAALNLDTLAMQNGSVQFAAPLGGGYKTVTVGQLSGSGQFVLNTNIGANQADKLVVEQGTGAYTLAVHDASTSAPTANAKLLLVDATGSNATFSLAGNNGIDVGAYKFQLQDAGGDYYLYNTGQTSDVASVAQAAAVVPTMLWYRQLAATSSYLGELRNGASDGGQLWIRAYDQRLRMNPGGTSADMSLYGAQIGRDVSIATAAGTFHVGATGGYGESDATYGNVGSGTSRPWNIGAYSGFNTPTGIFADALVSYLSVKQNVGVTTAGNAASGAYEESGYAVSVDGGKRWQLGSRWWAEPRIEATYQHNGGAAYQTSLGTPVVLESKSVVIGGAGARVGTTLGIGDVRLDPYLGVEAMHIFNGSIADTVGGTSLGVSLPQTWVSADLGVGAVLSQHVRAWGAFGYGKGHGYTQPWAATVGVSYVD